MARLLKTLDPQLSAYRDRRFDGSQEEFEMCLRESTTVYVGNLSFFSTEEQIHEIFSKTGELKRIIMGLDKMRKTPCGFCFVVYYDRKDTEDCVKWINGTVVDDRPIRVDFDWGFKEGRQYGRGKSGGQVRDEYRTDYDEGRGGYGKIVHDQLELRKQMESGMTGGTEAGGGGGGHDEGGDGDWGDDKPRSKRQRTGGRDEDNPRFRDGNNSDDER